MPDLRRLVALICIVVVAFATIVPAAGSDHFTDVLVPLWVVLFPVCCLFAVLRREEERDEQAIGLQLLLASRAPPRLAA